MVDRLGLFQRIVAVHFEGSQAAVFTVVLDCNSHYSGPADDPPPVPPILIYSYTTVAAGSDPVTTQEGLTDIDGHPLDSDTVTDSPGPGGAVLRVRLFHKEVKIIGAKSVTLNLSCPTLSNSLGAVFSADGGITSTGFIGGLRADIGPEITNSEGIVVSEAFARSSDRAPSGGHPSGTQVEPSAGSAILTLDAADNPFE